MWVECRYIHTSHTYIYIHTTMPNKLNSAVLTFTMLPTTSSWLFSVSDKSCLIPLIRSRKSFAFNNPVMTLIYSALSKELRGADFLGTSRTSVTSLKWKIFHFYFPTNPKLNIFIIIFIFKKFCSPPALATPVIY